MAFPRKYPWRRWLTAERTVIHAGIDYTLTQSIMYATIRNAASKHKVKVNLIDTGKGFIIEPIGNKVKCDT